MMRSSKSIVLAVAVHVLIDIADAFMIAPSESAVRFGLALSAAAEPGTCGLLLKRSPPHAFRASFDATSRHRRPMGMTMSSSVGQEGSTRILKQKLLALCSESEKGLLSFDSNKKADFDGVVEDLIKRNPTPNAAFSPLMSGRWDMQWTTEKEILFLVEKGFFGLKCLSVYQVTLECTLHGQVQSTFQPQEGQRFQFQFTSCSAKWRGLQVPLPPVGAGWGDQVYLDEELRIQRDSRGDVLIATRRA